MKNLYASVVLCFIALSLQAQPGDGSASFNKRNVPAVVYDLPYSEEAVTTGFQNQMQSFGNGKKMKNFIQYSSVNIPEISTQKMNVYLIAEKKDRKNDHTTLKMLIADEFDRFYSPQDNPEIFANAKQYLAAFDAPAAAANLELQIKEQEDVISKSDKKLKGLLNDGEDLEKQKKKIEDKIESNKKDIESQEKEIADLKQKLNDLTSQRKN